jgi:hypothetical protein
MPQNRDDNARGRPPTDRNHMADCSSHGGHGGIFESYATFLKDYYGQRGAISNISGSPNPNSSIEFSQEMQKNPPAPVDGPPTGEDTHTLEGDPRADSAGRPHLSPEEHERQFRVHPDAHIDSPDEEQSNG